MSPQVAPDTAAKWYLMHGPAVAIAKLHRTEEHLRCETSAATYVDWKGTLMAYSFRLASPIYELSLPSGRLIAL
jgi:hypothetical protein